MKKLAYLICVLIGMNSMAIEFFTEEDVARAQNADKVIEVSKIPLKSVIEKTPCSGIFYSRSARTYVVKKNKQAYLYMTSEKLADLRLCETL